MDIVIFKVIKKPLVVRLSQVIHKVVIQNPVRNQEGLRLKKWLLLDEDIISNCPSEKAPPQSPVYELNRCHLERLAFISSGIFSSNRRIMREAQTYLPVNPKKDWTKKDHVWLSRMLSVNVQDFNIKQKKESKQGLGTLLWEEVAVPKMISSI